jgi:hypothetical protein
MWCIWSRCWHYCFIIISLDTWREYLNHHSIFWTLCTYHKDLAGESSFTCCLFASEIWMTRQQSMIKIIAIYFWTLYFYSLVALCTNWLEIQWCRNDVNDYLYQSIKINRIQATHSKWYLWIMNPHQSPDNHTTITFDSVPFRAKLRIGKWSATSPLYRPFHKRAQTNQNKFLTIDNRFIGNDPFKSLLSNPNLCCWEQKWILRQGFHRKSGNLETNPNLTAFSQARYAKTRH